MPALEGFKWSLIVLELLLIIGGLTLLGGCASAPEGKAFEIKPAMKEQMGHKLVGWQWCEDGSGLQCPLFDIGTGVVELPHGARLGHTDLP